MLLSFTSSRATRSSKVSDHDAKGGVIRQLDNQNTLEDPTRETS